MAETFEADRKPVLKNVVLRIGGTIDMPPVLIDLIKDERVE